MWIKYSINEKRDLFEQPTFLNKLARADPETAEQFLQELEPYASVERIVGIKCELCENA